MTRKEKFAESLADYCSNPVGCLKLGDTSQYLMGIIKCMTIKDKKLKDMVFENIEILVEIDDYNKDLFGNDPKIAIKEIQSDYEAVFYNFKM